MTQKDLRFQRGFKLWEIFVILFIFQALILVLYPIFHPGRVKARQSSCASNMHQNGFALIGYTQDYDGKLPPVTAMARLDDGIGHEQQWGSETAVVVNGNRKIVPGIIDAYVKSQHIFQCPSVKRPTLGLSYLYNDLAAGERLSNCSQPGRSVLAAEGDDHLRNVGHAKSTKNGGDEAVFSAPQKGKAPAMILGAAIGDASTRHEISYGVGANYLFVDGHVKWTKPEDVFFPSRSSSSHSHKDPKTGSVLGPNPSSISGEGLVYQGRTYKVTFHLR